MRALKDLDWTLLFTVLALSALGAAFIWSTTHWTPVRDAYAGQQLRWIAVALLALIVIASVDYARWAELSYPAYALVLIALALVPVFGIRANNAQRWLLVPGTGMQFQPSELAKIVVVMALARYLRYQKQFAGFASLLPALLIAGVPMAMVLVQPDLGTTLVFIPALFAMLYVAGARWRHLGALIAAGVAAVPILWFFVMGPAQRGRITSFINPEADPFGAGWHLRQSMAAVASGGLAGEGFSSGAPVLLSRGFAGHTDFIFATISHEWGFLGGLLLLMLIFLFFSRGFEIARASREPYGRLLVTGFMAMLAFQVVVNIGMTLRLCPITGVTLPFVSYGGTSLLVCFVMAALTLNVGMRRKPVLAPGSFA